MTLNILRTCGWCKKIIAMSLRSLVMVSRINLLKNAIDNYNSVQWITGSWIKTKIDINNINKFKLFINVISSWNINNN